MKPVATIGLVGGSDLKKIAEQMGGEDGKLTLWWHVRSMSWH